MRRCPHKPYIKCALPHDPGKDIISHRPCPKEVLWPIALWVMPRLVLVPRGSPSNHGYLVWQSTPSKLGWIQEEQSLKGGGG